VDPVAVYVHTPFCPSKCGYCDFNSYAMEGEIIRRTVDATIAEISRTPHYGRPAKTIFFGGGTPTFLDPHELASLLEAVMRAHPPIPGCEITSEANPGTVDSEKFASMREAGFNRISIGAQSFFDDDLVRLGRVHRSGEIERAVANARIAGFENINVDLMFALPGQSKKAWFENLQRAIALRTEHLSLYCLTIEENTPFYKEFLKGLLDLPSDSGQVEMYEQACESAEEAGFRQYEISNFAKPGKECAHNLCYWNCEEYVAYGPGAVERVGDRRWTHVKHPRLYCERVEANEDLACESETLDLPTLRFERIMLGLRLNEGVDIRISKPDAEGLRQAIDRGWITTESDRMKLTQLGKHYCNQAVVLVA
jgi:oxygen-independent coproporphyrinogen-3 oxidase